MGGILLVEDDPRVGDAVRRLLGAGMVEQTGLSLEAVATTVAEGKSLVAARPPDVLLLDLALPDGHGLEVLAALPAGAATVTLVLTVFDDDAHIFEALSAGAVGYLLKDELVARLVPCVQEVLRGGAPMTPSIARRVLQSFRPPGAVPALPEPGGEHLTAREREVIELLARGTTYENIGKALGISTNTVRVYIRTTYRKLHATTKTEAITQAVRRRWIRAPY